ncbi:hypothetical protein AWV79_36395 [Cupriavidus sp. UYMMa02A]|nr:hypothetical protein AWV79_36395 [Cupriavidus sp. UYMMa02A]
MTELLMALTQKVRGRPQPARHAMAGFLLLGMLRAALHLRGSLLSTRSRGAHAGSQASPADK